jgi:hypothetical protein
LFERPALRLRIGKARRHAGFGGTGRTRRRFARPSRPCGLRRFGARALEGRHGRFADAGFHDDVGRTADQDQMLDVVATHQHKTALGVDMGSVDNRQPVLLRAQRTPEPAAPGGDPTNDPGRHRDQQKDEDEGDDESRRKA